MSSGSSRCPFTAGSSCGSVATILGKGPRYFGCFSDLAGRGGSTHKPEVVPAGSGGDDDCGAEKSIGGCGYVSTGGAGGVAGLARFGDGAGGGGGVGGTHDTNLALVEAVAVPAGALDVAAGARSLGNLSSTVL